MNKVIRKLSIVTALLVLVGAIATNLYLSRQKAPPRKKESKEQSLREVEVLEVRNQVVTADLDVQGRLAAFDKIDLFAEVSGTLKDNAKAFKVGTRFAKDALMLSLDDEEARLNLLSQKSTLLNAITQMMPDLKIDYPESFSQWEDYLRQFDPEKGIRAFPTPLNDQEKYFIASRNLYTQFYSIKSAETRLNKYNIYAPFSGVITEANINPGSLVRTGQKLGELMNTSSYELEASISLADLKFVRAGDKVVLYSDAVNGQWTGRVRRVSDQIDANTQTVIVFVGVSGKNLREGMYLRGTVSTSQVKSAFRVDRSLLVNQNSVYAVRNDALELLPVEVLRINGTKAIVKGLPDGTEILKQSFNGAFAGMKIKVRDSETPANTAIGEVQNSGPAE
ncbi:MAG: HlyD family efflux transporter periplasmic adaptor subunit [Bacteroidota bacterium]